MIQSESPFIDPDPYIVDGLVWVTNANVAPASPNDAATRKGLSVGPSRATRFREGTIEALNAAGIIGLYGPPLAAPAPQAMPAPVSAPTPPPAEKPAKKRISSPPPKQSPAANDGELF